MTRAYWYCLIYQCQIFFKYKKETDRNNKIKKLKYYINAQQQIPVPYGNMLHRSQTN